MAFNKAESGSAVLVDVNTGEVLAMANSPSYNPNNLSGTPKEAMRNRTITDVFEPGSTVKPMVVMTALQRGVVRENSVLNTVPYRINLPRNQRRGTLQRINPDRGITEVE